MKVFIICPVRNMTGKESRIIVKYITDLESKGIKVHFPPRDTNQDDPTGYNICLQNAQALINADAVHIYWNGKSKGSMFDLGMAFARNKMIVLINKVESTPSKSFENVLLELAKRSRWRV